MTFPNGGQRDEGNPNRKVAPAWGTGRGEPPDLSFRGAQRHNERAAATPAGGHWTEGFVGTYHGSDAGHSYFSADATGGGSTDSLLVPETAWKGSKWQVGKSFAFMPHEGSTNVNEGMSGWMLSGAESDKHYSNLPGFKPITN
jgi:hypothetical protein